MTKVHVKDQLVDAKDVYKIVLHKHADLEGYDPDREVTYKPFPNPVAWEANYKERCTIRQLMRKLEEGKLKYVTLT